MKKFVYVLCATTTAKFATGIPNLTFANKQEAIAYMQDMARRNGGQCVMEERGRYYIYDNDYKQADFELWDVPVYSRPSLIDRIKNLIKSK